MSDQPLAAPAWDRRRDSNGSGFSDASSIPASINQRPRQPQDGYSSIVQPIPTSSMSHRNPFQNPSPGPPDSPLQLQAPSAPWAGRPSSSHSNASVNLSVQYVPSKFSRPLSPGISYRKANRGGGDGRPTGMVKTGRGADAFAGNAGRMGKTGPGRLHWNRFKWILFLWMTVVSTSGVWRGFPFYEAIAHTPRPTFFSTAHVVFPRRADIHAHDMVQRLARCPGHPCGQPRRAGR